MKSKYQKIKGTFDILPPETQLWQEIEAIIHQTCQQFGFEEIRTPAVEFVNLFKKILDMKQMFQKKCLVGKINQENN